MLNIAIVNDTAIAIEVLRRAVHTNPDYHILWVAHDGEEAIKLCERERPDVLLMDIHMPHLNGVKATKIIMERCPCPILIVTATIAMNSSEVFEAMGHGALDVVKTPTFAGEMQTDAYEALLHKIKIVSHLKSYGDRPQQDSTDQAQKTSIFTDSPNNAALPPLIVIGSSTGGPNALSSILQGLPTNFPAAIVIVQHIDSQFADGFADWLNHDSPLPVAIAKTGDSPTVGTVLVAGTNNHLIVRPNQTLRYTQDPTTEINRPSINVFFKSVAYHWPRAGTAVLLTGMGRDGAIGMEHLHRVGWQTIAQNEESCVIYGMPKAAVELGVIQQKLDPPAIAQALIRQFS